MANGSRRDFSYTSDDGLEYAVNLDESTYETLTLGFGQKPTAAAISARRILQVSNKRPLEPRYILCVQQDGEEDLVGRRQKFYIGNNSAGVWATATIVVVDGITYAITAKIGEKRYLPPTVDTGLLDGDVDDQVPA